MSIKTLHDAKGAKGNEFYTRYEDIAKEIDSYIKYNPKLFKDKTILLPCNDLQSNFMKYFIDNFYTFNIKKLICVGYSRSAIKCSLFDNSTPTTRTQERGKLLIYDGGSTEWVYLNGNGDFRSEEIINIRDNVDIIITNPPFSLMNEFFAWLMEGKKDFIIIGSIICVSYQYLFDCIKNKKIWLGNNIDGGARLFEIQHEGSFKNVPTTWLTNLKVREEHKPIECKSMTYNLEHNSKIIKAGYPKYINLDAIDVCSIRAIPSDYRGVMGVPNTFLSSYCQYQFDIVGCTYENNNIYLGIGNVTQKFVDDYKAHGGRGHITANMHQLCLYDKNNIPKLPYSRVLIRYTDEWIKNHPHDFN